MQNKDTQSSNKGACFEERRSQGQSLHLDRACREDSATCAYPPSETHLAQVHDPLCRLLSSACFVLQESTAPLYLTSPVSWGRGRPDSPLPIPDSSSASFLCLLSSVGSPEPATFSKLSKLFSANELNYPALYLTCT